MFQWRKLGFRAMVLGALLVIRLSYADTLPAPMEWLPEGALMAIEIANPEAVIAAAERSGLSEVLSSSSEFGNAAKLLRPAGGIDTLKKLAAGGITYAVYPQERNVFIVDADSAATIMSIQQLAQSLIALQKNLPQAAGRVFYREHPGGAAWSLDGKQFFATYQQRLIASNRPEVLKALFEPRPSGVVPLASSTPFAEARKAAGRCDAAWFVNMAMLSRQEAFHKGMALDTSAWDAILNGVWKQSLANARWLAMSLHIDSGGLNIRAVTDGRPQPSLSFSVPEGPGQGTPPFLQTPNQLLTAAFWRDLATFYAARHDIFPERSSAAILFENFMEIFFSGRELRNDVLAHFCPAIRLVVAAQRYDPEIGMPEERYPAVALVFWVDDPENFGEVFEEAWQKAIGITNFTRGQQAQPGLILDKAKRGEVTFTYAYFSTRGENDRSRLPARFNLRPALVRYGHFFILSSADGLARDLIDAIRREGQNQLQPISRAHTRIEISAGDRIAEVIEANRAVFLRQSVLAGGKKPEEAARELDRNLALLRRLGSVSLSITAARSHEAQLDIRWK